MIADKTRSVTHSHRNPTLTGTRCCREEQDLASGAVLQAVLEEGEGDENPVAGDLVRSAKTPSFKRSGYSGRGMTKHGTVHDSCAWGSFHARHAARSLAP